MLTSLRLLGGLVLTLLREQGLDVPAEELGGGEEHDGEDDEADDGLDENRAGLSPPRLHLRRSSSYSHLPLFNLLPVSQGRPLQQAPHVLRCSCEGLGGLPVSAEIGSG